MCAAEPGSSQSSPCASWCVLLRLLAVHHPLRPEHWQPSKATPSQRRSRHQASWQRTPLSASSSAFAAAPWFLEPLNAPELWCSAPVPICLAQQQQQQQHGCYCIRQNPSHPLEQMRPADRRLASSQRPLTSMLHLGHSGPSLHLFWRNKFAEKKDIEMLHKTLP